MHAPLPTCAAQLLATGAFKFRKTVSIDGLSRPECTYHLLLGGSKKAAKPRRRFDPLRLLSCPAVSSWRVLPDRRQPHAGQPRHGTGRSVSAPRLAPSKVDIFLGHSTAKGRARCWLHMLVAQPFLSLISCSGQVVQPCLRRRRQTWCLVTTSRSLHSLGPTRPQCIRHSPREPTEHPPRATSARSRHPGAAACAE